MNLHNLANPNKAWIWIAVYGGNGRSLGIHAYEFDRGDPETIVEDAPPWANRWWQPRRFDWAPYANSINTLMQHGYVRPLCGKTSQSRWPSARPIYGYRHTCRDCETAAARRGIIVSLHSVIMEQDPLWLAILQEREAWRLANPRR